MRASVMRLQLLASILINSHAHFFAFEHFDVALQWPVQVVKNSFSNFLCVYDLVSTSTTLDFENASVMLLTARCWIDGRLVENHDVRLVSIQYILEHFNYRCLEVEHVVIIIENHLRLRNVRRVVQHICYLLSCALLPLRDLIVQVLWHLDLGNFCNFVSRNTVRLHACDPVVDGQLAFPGLDDLFEFLHGLYIRVLPSIVLDLHDCIEAFVFWELSVDTFKVEFVVIEDLQEAFHSEFVPPAILLHETEHSSQNVADITSTSHIGW